MTSLTERACKKNGNVSFFVGGQRCTRECFEVLLGMADRAAMQVEQSDRFTRTHWTFA